MDTRLALRGDCSVYSNKPFFVQESPAGVAGINESVVVKDKVTANNIFGCQVSVSYSLVRSATGKTDGSHRSKLIKGFIDKGAAGNELNFSLGVGFGVKICQMEVLAVRSDVERTQGPLWGHTFMTLAGKGV